MEKAIEEKHENDPSQTRSLAFFRKFNPINGGMEIGQDTIEFNGEEYLIKNIEACNVWNNMPNKFKVVMTRIATKNHT